MKRTDRDAWVADLRANEDKQGFEYLSRGGKQCCLGRLAILKGVRQISSGEDDPVGFDFEGRLAWGRSSSVESLPPDKWLEDIGLPVREARNLADMNDESISFAEIANYIEANVPVED